ncbi:MAG: hypothetical protein AYL33_002970 [Candidatus Bathyarchaeota archaeon B63]|nr:MAG: hypothetical protein AYL33_002970 [Candidatus Bathyarchaeota archaeon B63]
MRPVKIGVVADVHQGPLDIRDHLKRFVRDMNSSFLPDLVVELGDLLGYPANEEELRKIDAEYAECRAPRYYVMGNHDLASVDRSRFKKVLRIEYDWTSTTVDFLHIVFLDGAWGRWGPDRGAGPSGHIPEEELDWLRRDLKRCSEKQPIIAFCHYPIRHPRVLTRNSELDNEDELMRVFEGHNLIATFGGHHHYGSYNEVGQVHHICLHSMGWWVPEKITGSYAKIIITPEKLIVEGEGSQMDYRLSIKRAE